MSRLDGSTKENFHILAPILIAVRFNTYNNFGIRIEGLELTMCFLAIYASESFVDFTGYAFVYWNDYLPDLNIRYIRRQKVSCFLTGCASVTTIATNTATSLLLLRSTAISGNFVTPPLLSPATTAAAINNAAT